MADEIYSVTSHLPVKAHSKIKGDHSFVPTFDGTSTPVESKSFEKILNKYIEPHSETSVSKPMANESLALSKTIEEAKNSYQLMMEIHAKLIDAYKELNKIQ